jgi:16S rRNA (adenine1518-N6/adenine1519-N6)-dimethyltransferase
VLEQYVQQALQRARVRPSRARGQHFLIDDAVLAQVIRAAQLDGTELVVEVGPGLGTLTQSLAARAWRVAAFELDEALTRYLNHWVLPEARNIELYETAFNKYAYERLLEEHGIPFAAPHEDAMVEDDPDEDEGGLAGLELGGAAAGFDPALYAAPEAAAHPPAHRSGAAPRPRDAQDPRFDGQPATLKIVTNLPYQISSAFLHFAVDYSATYERIVVMLQREVAQRVVARPGDSGYNSFSLYLQTFLAARWVCDVPAASFSPPPRVQSAVLHIRPLRPEEQPLPRDRGLYLRLIEGVFRRRRKQLPNALQQAFGHLTPQRIHGALDACGIAHQARAEELDMAQYVALADELAGGAP